jgi:uncharacterized SAM-binding protein YcdF (DUF218 family)
MPDDGTVNAAQPQAGLRRLGAVARAVAALIVLGAIWLFACEAWRVRWPPMLVAFVAIGWPLAVAAWRPVVPLGWRWSLGVAALLVWGDLLVDWLLELPPELELAALQWEMPRIALVIAVSFAVAHLPHRPVFRHLRAAMMALSSAFAVLLAGLVLFIAIAGPRDQAARADAVLVLGREFFPDGSVRPELYARVDRAAELYRAGLAPHLVVTGSTGGARQPGLTEASLMRDLLVERGVPAEAIDVEAHARDTEENFACSVPILAERDPRRVLLVTDPWHMPRALYQGARYVGRVELVPAPANRSPEWTRPRKRAAHLVYEAVAYLFARVRRISDSPTSCPP